MRFLPKGSEHSGHGYESSAASGAPPIFNGDFNRSCEFCNVLNYQHYKPLKNILTPWDFGD
jgi:hypothetical protein